MESGEQSEGVVGKEETEDTHPESVSTGVGGKTGRHPGQLGGKERAALRPEVLSQVLAGAGPVLVRKVEEWVGVWRQRLREWQRLPLQAGRQGGQDGPSSADPESREEESGEECSGRAVCRWGRH